MARGPGGRAVGPRHRLDRVGHGPVAPRRLAAAADLRPRLADRGVGPADRAPDRNVPDLLLGPDPRRPGTGPADADFAVPTFEFFAFWGKHVLIVWGAVFW